MGSTIIEIIGEQNLINCYEFTSPVFHFLVQMVTLLPVRLYHCHHSLAAFKYFLDVIYCR